MQVLPLSLSVDFLRLVLAVVDDHARSQGQVKVTATATTTATATPAADATPPGTTAAAVAAAAGVAMCQKAAATGAAAAVVVAGEEGLEAAMGRGAGAPVHATAACFLSVGDFPRLYNRPGAIVRSLVKACKGDKPLGEVRGERKICIIFLRSHCFFFLCGTLLALLRVVMGAAVEVLRYAALHIIDNNQRPQALDDQRPQVQYIFAGPCPRPPSPLPPWSCFLS